MSTQGTLNREYSKLTAKGAILLPGKQDFMVYFGMFEILMFFEKFLIDHISAVDYVNDILSFTLFILTTSRKGQLDVLLS